MINYEPQQRSVAKSFSSLKFYLFFFVFVDFLLARIVTRATRELTVKAKRDLETHLLWLWLETSWLHKYAKRWGAEKQIKN